MISDQKKKYIELIDKQATKQMEKSFQRKLNTGKAIFSPRNNLHLDDIAELELQQHNKVALPLVPQK